MWVPCLVNVFNHYFMFTYLLSVILVELTHSNQGIENVTLVWLLTCLEVWLFEIELFLFRCAPFLFCCKLAVDNNPLNNFVYIILCVCVWVRERESACARARVRACGIGCWGSAVYNSCHNNLATTMCACLYTWIMKMTSETCDVSPVFMLLGKSNCIKGENHLQGSAAEE